MFGFNGDNLLLTGTGNSLQQGKCVNGLGQSLFTQVAFCNSPAFYRAAHRDMAQGLLKIPALGTGSDGQACPTVRGFDVVDQDQSDNVVSTYLLTASGQTAQDSAANVAALAGASAINNGSDNALVNKFMDPALGCKPYQFWDRTAASTRSGSQITDELMAAADQAAPVALVPLNDPMTAVNGQQSVMKTDVFRIGVGQPMVGAGGQAADTPGELLQEHDAGRHGARGGGREAVQRVRHPGARHRQQPVHVPGRAAVRLVGQPRLRRAAQRARPGQPDPRRERRGHRGHLQPAGDRHAAGRRGRHGHPQRHPVLRRGTQHGAHGGCLAHRNGHGYRHAHGTRPAHGHGYHRGSGHGYHGSSGHSYGHSCHRSSGHGHRHAHAHAYGFGRAVLRAASRGRPSHPGPDAEPHPAPARLA